ncbi:helix-turn-helix domain-containing protein [Haloarcula sp. S1CR25-12]|uniref:Helix-turn-helix domain-containing protein n=1 Tax=Haloarcula saliterrae TaxID=2950534 RepID=A0ABU2FAZ0_9EURY|nr:helix-turn-helix domain-containing protein [Haloarcula sp. S1CR25-12]MDS0259414.1 helix-turn-helix domain-containing protein [Haloarcula sp. S1CR25-12]
MRYVTVRISPPADSSLHPLMAELAAAPDITREAIHRVDLLADGTIVMVGESRGNQRRFERIMADSEYVYEYTTTGADGQWYSYSNLEPTEPSERMLAAQQQSTGVVEMPIVPNADGSIEYTLVGDEASLAESMPPEADGYTVELLETGDREPRAEDLFAPLTARQQTVLETAIEHGYYANPREATHEDIAAALGCSPSTVGEHLRKIEARVFSQFTR